MDFMSRGGHGAASQHTAGQPAPSHRSGGRGGWGARTMRLEIFIILTGAALLILALVFYWIFSGYNGESKQIKSDKYQAVFLNGGSTSGNVAYTTYFGHITSMNDRYITLTDVYYLTTAQATSSQSANPQLTKLGCQQLHSPYDAMYINRNQVAFWENLQDSGKVVQAIKTFQQQNPNGPNCNSTSSGTQQNTQSTQNAQTPSSSTGTNNTNNSTNSGQ